MEAFVVLIAECLLAPLLAGLVIVLEAVFAIVTGLIQWIVEATSKRRSKTGVGPKVGSRFLKWTTVVLLGLLAITALGTFAVNAFWFEPAVRFVLERVEQRKQIKVTFDSASGNLFTGELELHNATIERSTHPTSTFSLTSTHIDADLNMWQIIQRKPVLENLHINGLEGTFERLGKKKRVKPRREFRIDHLTIQDVTLKVKDYSRSRLPVDLVVAIDKLESKPFRSTHMIYDALLRSSATGSINDSAFSIGEEHGGSSYSSRWNLERLRLDQLGDYLFGSWNFIEEGILTIDVKHTFSTASPADIVMNWQLKFSDIYIRRPGKLVKRFSRMRDKIEDYLDEHGRGFSFDFYFSISEDQFINRPSLEAAGVWEKFREKSAIKAAATFTALKEKAIQAASKGKQKIKNYFEKRRRKRVASKED